MRIAWKMAHTWFDFWRHICDFRLLSLYTWILTFDAIHVIFDLWRYARDCWLLTLYTLFLTFDAIHVIFDFWRYIRHFQLLTLHTWFSKAAAAFVVRRKTLSKESSGGSFSMLIVLGPRTITRQHAKWVETLSAWDHQSLPNVLRHNGHIFSGKTADRS